MSSFPRKLLQAGFQAKRDIHRNKIPCFMIWQIEKPVMISYMNTVTVTDPAIWAD